MRAELTDLLRAVPFVPFIIFTRDGQTQAVHTVERLSVGRSACTYVDSEGYISYIPYTAIDRVTVHD